MSYNYKHLAKRNSLRGFWSDLIEAVEIIFWIYISIGHLFFIRDRNVYHIFKNLDFTFTKSFGHVGYRFTKPEERIYLLKYIDDIKLFAKNEKE